MALMQPSNYINATFEGALTTDMNFQALPEKGQGLTVDDRNYRITAVDWEAQPDAFGNKNVARPFVTVMELT